MMTESGTTDRLKVSEVIERYGECLELVPIDPHFHGISVGLYAKDRVCTVWTFSRRAGVHDRVGRIRDRLVALGGMEPVAGTHSQVTSSCGQLHLRPMRFLLAQAVGKDPNLALPEGRISIKDTRTDLILSIDGDERDGRWVYDVSGEGEAPNVALRLRMVVAGFVRYGEMEKVGETEVIFPCGRRHDELVRLVLPYSRNVSAVESAIEADAQRSQMTTGTLGFTPM